MSMCHTQSATLKSSYALHDTDQLSYYTITIGYNHKENSNKPTAQELQLNSETPSTAKMKNCILLGWKVL